jgi:hypothetical protein
MNPFQRTSLTLPMSLLGKFGANEDWAKHLTVCSYGSRANGH